MRRRNIIFLILFLLYLGLVLFCCFGSFQSLPNVQNEFFGIPTDKLVHFVMFLPFVFLCYLSFDHLARKPLHAFLLVTACLLAGALMAVATEDGQSLTSYRTGDMMDFVADAAGLAVSTIFLIAILIFIKRE